MSATFVTVSKSFDPKRYTVRYGREWLGQVENTRKGVWTANTYNDETGELEPVVGTFSHRRDAVSHVVEAARL